MKDTHTPGEPLYSHPMEWAQAWIDAGLPGHLVRTVFVLARAYDLKEHRVWHLSQAEFAKRTGMSERNVRKHFTQLEKLGVIARRHRYRKVATAERHSGVRFEDEITLLPVPMSSGSTADYRNSSSSTTGTPGPDSSSTLASTPTDGTLASARDSIGADAPHAEPPVTELEAAGDGDDDDMRIPAGAECLLCHQRRRHADWCTAQMRHDYVHDDVPF